MAKNSAAASRSNSVEVTDFDQARALAAAWRGVYHFLGGRVDKWEIVTPSEDNPEGGLIAHDFSANDGLNPTQILSDIGGRNRRLEFFPAYSYIVDGVEPPHFAEAQDMTNWMVQFSKGAVEEGTAKTPEYIRLAVQQYKDSQGLRTRRGPKRKIIRLDELSSVDPSQLTNIPQEELDRFLQMAQGVLDSRKSNGTTSTEEVAVS